MKITGADNKDMLANIKDLKNITYTQIPEKSNLKMYSI